MDDEFDLRVEDLMLLEEPAEFKKFLFSLHQEIDIYDVKPLKEFYRDLEWDAHVDVIHEFELIFDL